MQFCIIFKNPFLFVSSLSSYFFMFTPFGVCLLVFLLRQQSNPSTLHCQAFRQLSVRSTSFYIGFGDECIFLLYILMYFPGLWLLNRKSVVEHIPRINVIIKRLNAEANSVALSAILPDLE